MLTRIIYIFLCGLLVVLYGCSGCPNSIDDLYVHEVEFYEIYYAEDVDAAESALADIIDLSESYAECGLNSIPNLATAHYRLFDLYRFRGDRVAAERHLEKSIQNYQKMSSDFIATPETVTPQALERKFEQLDAVRRPKWKREEERGGAKSDFGGIRTVLANQ